MEEEAPAPKRRGIERPALDVLGVDELESYIAELRDEIARAEAAIARKQSHWAAADAFFRPSPA